MEKGKEKNTTGRILEGVILADKKVYSDDLFISKLIKRYATKCAVISSGLAIPSGPLGFLTLIPDLFIIWHIQKSMVEEIASFYNMEADFTKKAMIYCLFRQSVGQVSRDVVVRSAQRMSMRFFSSRWFRRLIMRTGLKVSATFFTKATARFIPVAGAIGVGLYSYYDTIKVAKRTIALCKGETRLPAPPDFSLILPLSNNLLPQQSGI
jgi:hypothetical protein